MSNITAFNLVKAQIAMIKNDKTISSYKKKAIISGLEEIKTFVFTEYTEFELIRFTTKLIERVEKSDIVSYSAVKSNMTELQAQSKISILLLFRFSFF